MYASRAIPTCGWKRRVASLDEIATRQSARRRKQPTLPPAPNRPTELNTSIRKTQKLRFLLTDNTQSINLDRWFPGGVGSGSFC